MGARLLNGTSWTLHSDMDVAILQLNLPPRWCRLHFHRKRRNREGFAGMLRILGWESGAAPERWAASGALVAELSAGQKQLIVFDRELTGFTLTSMDESAPLFPGLPSVLVGVRRSPQTNWAVAGPVHMRTSLH